MNGGDKLKKKVYKFIEKYPTKYKEGFIQTEVDAILKKFPEINQQMFDEALYGNTCMYNETDGLIQYHCDIQLAAVCGLENRELTVAEWD